MNKYRTVKFAVAALALATMTTTSTAVFAEDTAPTMSNTIGIGGETFFVLKSNWDLSKDMQTRGNDSYDRLRNILNNPKLSSKDILVKRLGNYGAKIVANGELIVPIGKAEAAAHNSTPMKLAKEWAIHLRKVMPMVNARPDLFAQSYARVSMLSRTE